MSACGTTGPSERDLLEASLQALIDHDSMDLDMFQGGPPIGAQTRRHFTPQIRHNHDAHHYLNTTTTTPQTPPSLPPWADAPSQHERAAPVSRCRHNMGSGQVRYAQAIKDALLLLGAQSMHGGNGCYDCPQFPLPHLEFDAGGCATVNDPYSNSNTLEDYDFTNHFPFLDYEPSCSRDIAMDEFYTINTPREPSPSALLPDAATTVAPPPSLPTPQSQSAESPPPPPRLERSYTAPSGTTSRKRPNPSSTDTNEAASPLPSSSSSFSQSGSPAAEGQKKERPHAAVEKRYRVSLNDKIEALRVCLESRKRPKRNSQQPLSPPSGDGGATGSGNTPAAGSTTTTTTTGPAARMSKAEVLSEAVEYVQQLEEENGVMLEQIAELVQRMQATQRALQLPSFAAGRNSF